MNKIKTTILLFLVAIILRIIMFLLGLFISIAGLVAPNHIFEGMKSAFIEMKE